MRNSRLARFRGEASLTWLLSWLVLAGHATPGSALEAVAALDFALRSEPVAHRNLEWLRGVLTAQQVEVLDPYEGRRVTFDAFRFDQVLDAVYGDGWREEEELLFRCRDGYEPSVPVKRVLDHAGWLAFDRTDATEFTIRKRESGQHKSIDLAPFYLVWANLEDPELRADGDYGWPYQLVGIDLIRARERFPKMAPPAASPQNVMAGFTAFRSHCSRCHAINREGGSIGPELNDPINPIEVREREWLQRWIDDPGRILPTARMPRLNPALEGRDQVIDEILAYLEAMSEARRAKAKEMESGR